MNSHAKMLKAVDKVKTFAQLAQKEEVDTQKDLGAAMTQLSKQIEQSARKYEDAKGLAAKL